MTDATQHPRVRFAPSPTGRMHVGHLRAALPNVLFALKHAGTFIVRFEDTDIIRQVAGAEHLLLQDLAWLGFQVDESITHGGAFGPYNTLARHERGDYQAVVQALIAAGRAYECFTSPEELELMRKLQRARNEPPRYDNRHRNLSASEKAKFRAEGREPVIRFQLADGEIKFTDLVRGEQKFQAENLGGDPIIVRANGVPLFTLGGVVDDINMNITHVIRGEDHIVNTAQQVQIFAALGKPVPVFAHLPLMLDAQGQKMSKRLGSLRVADLQQQGYHPLAICSYMAGLGFSEQAPLSGLQDIAAWYDLTGISRAPVRFDEQQMLRVNASVLHKLSLAEAQPYLAQFLPAEAMTRKRLEPFWLAARENSATFADVQDLYDVAFHEPDSATLPGVEDKEYLHAALQTAHHTLPQDAYTTATWATWTDTLKAQTGRKGKALFMPLRKALTGRDHGPDMANLLPVIGPEATKQRLERCLSH